MSDARNERLGYATKTDNSEVKQRSPQIVIVGGGTAGWMTAAYLKAAFSDGISVSLIESDRIATIGVGEATFSTVRHYFDFLGLEERDWMPSCQATYKLGIRFENWNRSGEHFYHPFERLRIVDGFPLTDWWLNSRPGTRFDSDTFICASLCDAKKSPRYLDGSLFEQEFIENSSRSSAQRTTLAEQTTQFPYAYHFDAALLARFLTKYATQRGVSHIVDDVLDVALNSRGDISHVTTARSGPIAGDLFIDCTGFKGLLINEALGVPFRSFSESLPNDRAVALRVPTDGPAEGMRPCTTATAQEAGWIWTIPLFGRNGTGYVYSSEYSSAERAENVLRDFVGPASCNLEANHIRMRVGRSEESWVKNCVAIGLSSGFVEPLESTGIFFIQNAVEQLVKHFPSDGRATELRRAYNSQVSKAMDGVFEFLALHYYAAGRADNQYWKDAKNRPLPDGLLNRIAAWEHKMPDSETIFPHYHGFEAYSYTAMLLGLGGVPIQAPPALQFMSDQAAREEFARVQSQAQRLISDLPSHYDFIAKFQDPHTGIA